MCPPEGRVTGDCKSPIVAVLDMLSDVKDLEYGIIVNKLSDEVYNDLKKEGDDYLNFKTSVERNLPIGPMKYFFIKNNPQLAGKKSSDLVSFPEFGEEFRI